MAAIHIIIDPREKPVELRWNDGGQLYRTTLPLNGLVLDAEEIDKLERDATALMLKEIMQKYVDKIIPEHRMVLEAIDLFRQIFKQHRFRLEALVKAENDMRSWAGLASPLFSKSFSAQIKTVVAALTFLDEIDDAAKETGIETVDGDLYERGLELLKSAIEE